MNNNKEEQLLLENMGMIVSQAIRHRIKSSVIDRDDLQQIGAMAFIKAIRSFDCSRGVKLGTFAWTCIIRDIRKEIAKFTKIQFTNRSTNSLDNEFVVDQNISTIWELFPNSLEEKELSVIESRLEGKTLSQIGKELGCSKEWVNKILSCAINKIRVANAG